MKSTVVKKGKFKCLIAVVIALSQILTACGINQSKNADESGAGEKNPGNDQVLLFEPEVEQFVTYGQLKAARDVVKTRLERLYNYYNHDVTITTDGRIRVRALGTWDIENLTDIVTRRGELELCYQYTVPGAGGEIRYALAMNSTSDNIEDAYSDFGMAEADSDPGYFVNLLFTRRGQTAFKNATQNIVDGFYNGEPVEKRLSIIVDGEVIAAPEVSEVIDADNCIIYGSFDETSAGNLANIISSGAMPFALKSVPVTEEEEITVVLEPDTADTGTVIADRLAQAAKTLSGHFRSFYGVDASVNIEGNRLVVRIPASAAVEGMNAALTCCGQMEFRYVYDASVGGKKYALAFKASDSYIRDVRQESGAYGGRGFVRLGLTPGGRAALKAATGNVVGGSYRGEAITNELEVTLDGMAMSSSTVYNAVDNDVYVVITEDAETAAALTSVLNRGELPFGFRIVKNQ